MSLYHEAAQILSSTSNGGSIKSKVFGRKDVKSPPSQLYALALETSKWSGVLKEVIQNAELLKHERKLTPILSLLLVHDLLLVKGGIRLPQSHGLRAATERHKGRLTSELTRARLRRKAPTLEALKEQVDWASAGEEANYPRWVRVNMIKSSVEEQLETTFAGYEHVTDIQEVMSRAGKRILIDPHVPSLVAVTPGRDLTKTEAYSTGKIILQDKASCFPAYLLDPQSEDGDVVDACAAPGNKTTHLAAILHTHLPDFEAPEQTIYAFEKDSRRAQTLEKMVKQAGSRKITRIGLAQDFLQVDPHADRFSKVAALLLDPSCSGSGIVGRESMPELHMPDAAVTASGNKAGPSKTAGGGAGRKRKLDETGHQDEALIRDDDGNETVLKSEQDLKKRLEALSSFQLSLLEHAFQFPSARKITYSTCSIHAEENERVVMRALASGPARRGGWGVLLRNDQVSGMRDWPVRGLTDECGGDEDIAQACIRTYKDDGRGVMGFFVAGFVRELPSGGDDRRGAGGEEADDGPYERDEDGRMIRDVTGMPVLKATGQPVMLNPRDEDAQANEEEDEDEDDDDESGGDETRDLSESSDDSDG